MPTPDNLNTASRILPPPLSTGDTTSRPPLGPLNQYIINLTDSPLTPTQTDILSRGLGFIPTNNSRSWEYSLFKDIQAFRRRLLVHIYFKDKPSSTFSQFATKSTWCPPASLMEQSIRDVFWDAELDRKQALSSHRGFSSCNITGAEKSALSSLKKRSDWVFNKADKGNNIVIQKRCDYIWESVRQLSNPAHYVKLDEPLYPSTALRIHRLVNELKTGGFITEREMQFLRPPECIKPRRLYTLPKIHKAPEEWSIPFRIPPGRPIISDIGSESYNVAKFIDHFLKPLVFQQPSFIKDSFHFLEKLNLVNNNTPNTFLVTCDVVSMYTNIDNSDGLKTVSHFFQSHPDPKRPDSLLLQLLEVSLKNNDFLFNGEFWLQVSGTAMGKVFAPSYANLFMAKIEEDFFNELGSRPPFYVRFLDDIFFLWNDTRESLDEFLHALGSYHKSIKLTHNISQEQVDFLDLTILNTQGSNTLRTKVYFKATNTHRLLHKHSFHPGHTFKGIVKGQLHRFHRLCSNRADFNICTAILFKGLRQVKYSKRFLQKVKREFLLEGPKGHTNLLRSPSREDRIIPLIYTHHLTAQKICKSLILNLRSLGSEALEGCKLIKACRRNRNLADILVRNKM